MSLLRRIRIMGSESGTPTPPPPSEGFLILINDAGDVILVNDAGDALAWS